MSSEHNDFTVGHYSELLRLAKRTYAFATYDSIPWGERFVLWRHDLDLSINRGLKLAEIEAKEGIVATYFLNPRSDFYNPFDASQSRLIRRILALGHQLGLHFDAAYHCVESEQVMAEIVKREASWLETEFQVPVSVFSYHNPNDLYLQFDAEMYAGLVNTYSQRFRTAVGYCSDSNGYWRHRRLYDVLSKGEDRCLQVLTHPGWWQDQPMPPRNRVYRSAIGRALYTIRENDSALENFGRTISPGPLKYLQFLKIDDRRSFELCDFLWNQGCLNNLTAQLFSLLERRIEKLCINILVDRLGCPLEEVKSVFDENRFEIAGIQLLSVVFADGWESITGLDEGQYYKALEASRCFVKGADRVYFDYQELCWFLAKSISDIELIDYIDCNCFAVELENDVAGYGDSTSANAWFQFRKKYLEMRSRNV